MANQHATLGPGDIERICGPAADDRDFIQRTFGGRFFTGADLAFLDSAWSHIDGMTGPKRDLAISALVLSAARRQPRGVFTVCGSRYDDGRRDLRLSLREHFAERAAEYNGVVFDSGQPCAALCGDVFGLPAGGHDVVYLDPPYAPPGTTTATSSATTFSKGCRSTGAASRSWSTPGPGSWPSATRRSPTPAR